jgi:hypothetical protein
MLALEQIEQRPPKNRKCRDISGRQFGCMTVVEYAGFYGKMSAWKCRCECGTELYLHYIAIIQEVTWHCGCQSKQHGGSGTSEHGIWCGMKQRCHNPKAVAYQWYGARGISVCDRWRGVDGFKNFMADMGPRPSPKHSIDRKDNDGNYCPENCRWATDEEQARNTAQNVNLTFNGRTMCNSAWAKELGITPEGLRQRLQRMPVERALTMRRQKRGPRKSALSA